ncbi:sulfotransferase [Mangrovicoccus sp. HB161399]|uniref:sulfotransferase family protein n=1 Tax=Mangrovicoccus sp. HB161399 TaxID=2720392 RepID=UPI0015577F4B|nr:sulfotransferase [Mangrovicoccus sp. HB161399]
MARKAREKAKRRFRDGPPPGPDPAGTVLRCGRALALDPADGPAAAALAALSDADCNLVRSRAAALAGAGDLGTALALLLPLAHARPTDAEAAAMAARALILSGRPGPALELARAALETSPGLPELMSAKGAALHRLGRFAEAAEALAAGAGDADTLNLLGRCREVTGDLAGAEAAFRQAAAIPGAPGQVWHNLAGHVDFARDGACLAALGTARAAAPASEAAMFDLALSKALSDRGKAEESFAMLARANAAIAAALPPGLPARRRAAIAAALPRAAELQPVPPPPGAPRALLIVGMPRSGTSLAEQILARHPQVAAGGEMVAMEAALAPLLKEPRRWPPEASAAFAASYRAAIAAAAGNASAATDKMPANAYLAGHALAALPEVRVIWMRRHPMAAGFSCFRTHFGAKQAWSYRLAEIAEEFRATETAMDGWRAAHPGRIHECLFERLAADPATQIARLLDFCGLDPDPACFGSADSGAPVRTASARQARGPIRSSGTDTWRVHEAELAVLAELLASEIRAHEARLQAAAGT